MTTSPVANTERDAHFTVGHLERDALRLRGVLEHLTATPLATWPVVARRRRPQTILVNAAELATLWHPPTEAVRNPGLDRLAYRQLELPRAIPTFASHSQLAVARFAAVWVSKRKIFASAMEARLL